MSILNLKQHSPDFRELKMTLNIHQKIILAFFSVNFLGLMYEELFHIFIELFHTLFESVEHILDIITEHLFDTSTHETQVIVFYTILPFILYSLYRLCRFLPRWYNNFKKNLHQQKAETLSQWRALSLVVRLEWWLFFFVYIFCLLFFSF